MKWRPRSGTSATNTITMHTDLLRYVTLLIIVRALWIVASPSLASLKLESDNFREQSWHARKLFDATQHECSTRQHNCYARCPRPRSGPRPRPGRPAAAEASALRVRTGGSGGTRGVSDGRPSAPPDPTASPAPPAERAECASDADPTDRPPAVEPSLAACAPVSGATPPCPGAAVTPPTGEGTLAVEEDRRGERIGAGATACPASGGAAAPVIRPELMSPRASVERALSAGPGARLIGEIARPAPDASATPAGDCHPRLSEGTAQRAGPSEPAVQRSEPGVRRTGDGVQRTVGTTRPAVPGSRPAAASAGASEAAQPRTTHRRTRRGNRPGRKRGPNGWQSADIRSGILIGAINIQ